VRTRVVTSLSTIILVVSVGACTGRSISPALHLGVAKPLPRVTDGGAPTTFARLDEVCSDTHDASCSSRLALYSTRDGTPIRTLATTPIGLTISTMTKFIGVDVGITYPSRGPTGDVWFVLTESFCESEIYRMDARTAHVSLVAKQCGLRAQSPVQSPNGRFLAYILSSPDLNGSVLAVRDLVTGHVREVLPFDKDGVPPRVPIPILPHRGTPSDAEHGPCLFPGCPPIPPRFMFGVAWSIDSAHLSVVDLAQSHEALDVIDGRTLKLVDQIESPPTCDIRSSTFDASGLLLGLTCDPGAGREQTSSLVQYASDLRTQVSDTALPTCAAYPSVVAGGPRHDVILISSYRYCPPSAWPGKPPVRAIGPEELVEIFSNGQLRDIHVYTSDRDFFEEVGW